MFPLKKIEWFFICKNLSPLLERILCAKLSRNWPIGSGEEDFLKKKFVNEYGSYIENGRGFSYEQIWIPFT